jgi:hypothetical protein
MPPQMSFHLQFYSKKYVRSVSSRRSLEVTEYFFIHLEFMQAAEWSIL